MHWYVTVEMAVEVSRRRCNLFLSLSFGIFFALHGWLRQYMNIIFFFTGFFYSCVCTQAIVCCVCLCKDEFWINPEHPFSHFFFSLKKWLRTPFIRPRLVYSGILNSYSDSYKKLAQTHTKWLAWKRKNARQKLHVFNPGKCERNMYFM